MAVAVARAEPSPQVAHAGRSWEPRAVPHSWLPSAWPKSGCLGRGGREKEVQAGRPGGGEAREAVTRDPGFPEGRSFPDRCQRG